jgi:hypothetical protein
LLSAALFPHAAQNAQIYNADDDDDVVEVVPPPKPQAPAQIYNVDDDDDDDDDVAPPPKPKAPDQSNQRKIRTENNELKKSLKDLRSQIEFLCLQTTETNELLLAASLRVPVALVDLNAYVKKRKEGKVKEAADTLHKEFNAATPYMKETLDRLTPEFMTAERFGEGEEDDGDGEKKAKVKGEEKGNSNKRKGGGAEAEGGGSKKARYSSSSSTSSSSSSSSSSSLSSSSSSSSLSSSSTSPFSRSFLHC